MCSKKPILVITDDITVVLELLREPLADLAGITATLLQQKWPKQITAQLMDIGHQLLGVGELLRMIEDDGGQGLTLPATTEEVS